MEDCLSQMNEMKNEMNEKIACQNVLPFEQRLKKNIYEIQLIELSELSDCMTKLQFELTIAKY